MRVAFVSNVVYPFVTGGAEKRIYEISTRLADDGHDVTVYGRHFWEGPEEIVHEGVTLRAAAPAADLYEDEGRRSITEAIDFAARLLPVLRRHIDDHDLVVASVFPYFPVLSSKLATLGTDTPVVTTWHEVWRDYWNEYLGHLAPFGKGIERITARCPQYPITVSGVTADRLTQIGPGQNQIRTIANGIDYDQIRNVDPAPDGFDVLFAGRLIEDKRVDVLLRAFDDAAPADATLGIIGDGPKRDELEQLASDLDTTDRITFLGFLDEYEDVLGHMRAADVFASPSTREGFGITYAEAMAANCTVIGATHPDSAADEVIADAGFLVDPTADALADTLTEVLNGRRPSTDPVERAQQYDWDSVAAQAEDAYRRAADGTW